MKRILLLIPIALAVLGGTLVWSFSTSDSTRPSSKPNTALDGDAKAGDDFDTLADLPTLLPKAVIPETHYDFGTMDPYRVGHHTFVIRNEGQGPLKLKAVGSTCKCTVGKLAADTIPPGEEGEITLDWKTAPMKSAFSHSATVTTNDPNNQRIRFSLRGHVQQHLGADPPELLFPRVHPGTTATGGTIVSSEVWPEFRIVSVKPSHDDIQWEVEPAESQVLAALGSQSGYLLSVTLPDSLPSGQFNHSLVVTVASAEQPDVTREYEIPIVGSVLRRLAVYGEGIDASGTIRFGRLAWGAGAKKSFLVKTYDDEPELDLQKIEVHPEWIKARLTPERVEAGRPGLYRLTVEVPSDAPVGSYTAHRAGHLELITGHPRIGNQRLKVEYAIAPPERRKVARGKE